MDALSAELEIIGGDLDGVRRRHDGVRDAVGSLRRRLDGIAERWEARGENAYRISSHRRREEEEEDEEDEREAQGIEREEEDEEEVQRRRQVLRRVEEEEHHTKGTGGTVAMMAREGGRPLTIVSMVEARTVATYVGRN